MASASENVVHDVVVIGAGIAGLVCARALQDAGRKVVVLDKSRGVGGRCATRRMLGQPVDIGLTYYHADDPELLAALAAVPATLLPGWPQRIVGSGPPCHPATFRAGQQRLAFAEGVNVFPKHLARGLDVRLSHRVARIDPMPTHVVLALEDGPPVLTRDVVLTIPTPQAEAILPSAEGRSLRAVETMLAHVAVQPSLTLVLGYSLTSPLPDFDVLYPEETSIVQLIAHDSVKREDPSHRVLVVQGRGAWSRQHLEEAREDWCVPLLAEAARLVGDWVAHPAWSESQRWRFAKTEPNTEMSAPQVFGLPGGGQLGLAAEAFALEGGVQGAFRAGHQLAQRMLAAARD